jgi:hypothetical protein
MTRYAPLWQQEGSFNATQDRQVLGSIWPNGGLTGGALTLSPTTMVVTIAPGTCAVPVGAGQGVELCYWDANETVTLTNGPAAGNTRIDLITVQVRDDALDAGGQNNFVMSFVTGTPSTGTPAVPAAPARAFGIATVTVPASVTNLNTATWAGTTVALSSPDPAYVPVSSGAAPVPAAPTVAPPAGLLWVDTSVTPAGWNPLPPPVASGAGISTFTDVMGDLWVAKGGIAGGAWRRATSVIHGRYQMPTNIAGGTGNNTLTCTQADIDPFGCIGSNGFVAPITGSYLVTGWANLATAPGSVGGMQIILTVAGTQVTVGGGIVYVASSPMWPACSTTDIFNCVAGNVVQAVLWSSQGMTIMGGSGRTGMAMTYLGPTT